MNEPRQSAAATGTEGASLPTAQAHTIWPGIGRVSAHEDLPKHLFTVAAMHARRALAAAAAIPPYTSSPIEVGMGRLLAVSHRLHALRAALIVLPGWPYEVWISGFRGF